jgi:hypothetical protein
VKRRADESAPPVPPPELVDYKRWCAEQGVAPYGNGDPVSLRCAASQWSEWERARERWAAERGLVEDDLRTSGCGAPFDPDSISSALEVTRGGLAASLAIQRFELGRPGGRRRLINRRNDVDMDSGHLKRVVDGLESCCDGPRWMPMIASTLRRLIIG